MIASLKFLFIALIVIFISGCQTTPSSSQTSIQKPLELQPPQGKTSLVLIRPMYIAYGLRGLSIKINGVPSVELSNKSYSVIYVDPGKQKIESEGGFLSWSKKEKTIETDEKQVTFLLWLIEDDVF